MVLSDVYNLFSSLLKLYLINVTLMLKMLNVVKSVDVTQDYIGVKWRLAAIPYGICS